MSRELTLKEAIDKAIKIVDKLDKIRPLPHFYACDNMIEAVWEAADNIAVITKTSGIGGFSPDEIQLLKLKVFERLVELLRRATNKGIDDKVREIIKGV